MSVLDKFRTKPLKQAEVVKDSGKPEHPTIIVKLTPEGLKVSLEAWRHNAPVNLLAALDVRVQQAIHQWRGKFLAQEAKFNTPNARERDLSEEQRRLA